ncbi:MAG: ATP-binding protein [Sporichthyaceae bacterium]
MTPDDPELTFPQIAAALERLRDGDFGVRLPHLRGPTAEIALRFNEVARRLEQRSVAIHTIGQIVGREGRIDERMVEKPLRGTWLANARAINDLIEDLTRPVSEIATVIAAVAEGDLSQYLALETDERPLRGEFRSIARTVNTMVDQLSAFASGLEEKAQQLAQASRYKSEFLANMSHELRTPLNSLLLLSRLLAENEDENLTDQQIEFARVIHRSGSDLLTLIEDILDLSKIEAGRMRVTPGEVELDLVRAYVESAFRPQAQDKGLTLHVEVDPDLPELVTDAQRLQQILRNLLANAVKFTHAGSVTLRVVAADPALVPALPSLATSPTVFAFVVSDTGIGIPADKLALVFEAFQQADGTTSRKYGGTGLGLSISRELAKLLGGAILAHSIPDQGSTFTLYLPATVPASPDTGDGDEGAPAVLDLVGGSRGSVESGTAALRGPAIERRTGGSVDRLAGCTVLIVDDDIRNVYALTSALELHGMAVLYSDNGADGIARLQEAADAGERVDVVLMDAMMPMLDGRQTTRAIRELPAFTDLPIIFLTARAMPGDREKALGSGASDYITKPVDLDELLDLLAAWVLRRPGTPHSDATGSPPDPSGKMPVQEIPRRQRSRASRRSDEGGSP